MATAGLKGGTTGTEIQIGGTTYATLRTDGMAIPAAAAAGDAVRKDQLIPGNVVGVTTSNGTGTFPSFTAAGTAGQLGEYIAVESGQTPSNSAATNVWGVVSSISLTAGDWLLWGSCLASVGTGTGFSGNASAFISSSSGDNTTNLLYGKNFDGASFPTASLDASLNLNPIRVSISSTTTYYLKLKLTFTGGQPVYYSSMQAVRHK